MVPDLDGLGVVVDVFQRVTGATARDPSWYEHFHHSLLHGLPGAVLYLILTIACGTRSPRVLGLVLISYHFHLICDLAGSRGPSPLELWPIHYLAPLSHAWSFMWPHQWPLNAWPNTVFTAALILWSLGRAVRNGSSPVSIFNPHADTAVVSALRARWSRYVRPGTAG